MRSAVPAARLGVAAGSQENHSNGVSADAAQFISGHAPAITTLHRERVRVLSFPQRVQRLPRGRSGTWPPTPSGAAVVIHQEQKLLRMDWRS